MLCDEEGFTYNWVPIRPPTLVKDDFEVTCYPSHNVPIMTARGDPEEDDATDTELPDIVDSSSDEGWQQAMTRRRKRWASSSAEAAPAANAEDDLGEGVKRRSRP